MVRSTDLGIQSMPESLAAADIASVLRPKKNNICAVMVTHNPDDGVSERIGAIRHQVEEVLIVDNNSEPGALSLLRCLSPEHRTHLIRNEENVGIASALDQGVRWAAEHGYHWALLLDQDTIASEYMLDLLIEAYNLFPRSDKLAVIGSNYVDPQTGKLAFSSKVPSGVCWKETEVVITSGSLMSLTVYKTIGPFRAEYFIDCVDLEYCLRARSKGFKVIVTRKPLMVHGIGQPTRHHLLGKSIATTNHSPLRRYYLMRNHVALAKEYLTAEPTWMLKSFGKLLKSVILVCLFERDKLTKMKCLAMGLSDGLSSRFDRQPSLQEARLASVTHR